MLWLDCVTRIAVFFGHPSEGRADDEKIGAYIKIWHDISHWRRKRTAQPKAVQRQLRMRMKELALFNATV
jgi:hypothetical protein